MRLIALIILLLWTIIACIPAFISIAIIGINKTDKWIAPIYNWCIKKLL